MEKLVQCALKDKMMSDGRVIMIARSVVMENTKDCKARRRMSESQTKVRKESAIPATLPPLLTTTEPRAAATLAYVT